MLIEVEGIDGNYLINTNKICYVYNNTIYLDGLKIETIHTYDELSKLLSNKMNFENYKITDPTKSASEKQISYAKIIAEKLGVELPRENTCMAYSNFITENKKKFQELKQNIGSENTKEIIKQQYEEIPF